MTTQTTYAQSCAPREGDTLALFERIDASLRAVADEMGATPMAYPTLIARDALEQAGYPDAFPHLLMLAASLREPEREDSDRLEPVNLASAQWCLSPAVCYHVYSGFAGRRLEQPAIVTARGQCFRYESQIVPGRRQIEFSMREIVFLGSADWVRKTALDCKRRVEQAARRFDLAGDWGAAEDPFFLPRAQGSALLQRLKEMKLEYRSAGDDPLALASVNFHDDFFGRRFEIRDSEGEFIHTACVAAGLDRWESHMKGDCTCHR